MSDLTGHDVIKQANDNGIFNTNAAAATGAIVGGVGAIGSILVIGGWIQPPEVEQLKGAAGQIVPACFLIAAIVQGVWTRYLVWSGRSAARIAVENAKPTTTVPTLAPPP